MSSKIFTVIGDSNVKNHVNKNSRRASPLVKGCQVLHCGALEAMASSLEKVRAESDMCMVSCMTNFLADAEGPESVAHRIDPVLQAFRESLHDSCSSNPGRHFFVAPPMYRSSPMWYRNGLPEILTNFSKTLFAEKPENLHLLPSFPTPDFEKDGVHLTPYAGLEFILHLFDGSLELLEGLGQGQDVAVVKNCELNRVLEDRVVALEQDHRRLNNVVDDKIAIDAEMADFIKNERFEDSFVIEGTPRISDEITGKPWQDQAIKDVQFVLKELMGREMGIVFIQNATARQPDALVVYNVKMSTVAESKSIRLKFGSFFLGGKDKRPPALKPFSIKNRVTLETRIRISVLKLIAKRYRDSNQGSKVQVQKLSYISASIVVIPGHSDPDSVQRLS